MNDPRPTVLVIEDESQIRRFVRTALEEEGCRVREAGNASDGLAEAGSAAPIS
jgi:two-component system KDP operon response regulator KdpE